ncbi:hypothetical protein BDZ45DRAFT_804554 [Acephala macrosclerotiorum]|nr:hypothetical protein BDZ45DRAFT_804554 [Acephala macrosclerotiorum]
MNYKNSVGALLFSGAPAAAFWRMPCRARSGLARIDPLVSNGTLSEHAHAISESDDKLHLNLSMRGPPPTMYPKHKGLAR